MCSGRPCSQTKAGRWPAISEDIITEAVQSLGLFQVPHPPLVEHFNDWLVDALRDEHYTRSRASFTRWAYRTSVLEDQRIPDWAHGLPPENPPERA